MTAVSPSRVMRTSSRRGRAGAPFSHGSGAWAWPRRRLARAKHVDPVQTRFGFNPLGVALIPQPGVVELPRDVLAHLVSPQHPSDLASELRRPQGRAGAPRRLACDPFQPRFGRGQQLLALARAFLGQQRVAARHQALARIVRRDDLGQVLLVKQRPQQRVLLDRGAHLQRLQRTHPSQTPVALEVLDPDLRQQAPVPDQGYPFEPEALLELHHLVRDGVGVGSVSRIRLDGDRTPSGGAQHGVHEPRLAALAVAVVSEAHQRAGAALVVA